MKRTFLLLIVLSVLTLTSCAKYEAASLETITTEFGPLAEQVDDVAVACKALSNKECKRYLGRDVTKKGFQPVQITVNNQSNKYLLFSPNSISLPCATAEAVASKVHTSTAARTASYSVGSLFFWPLAIPAVVDGYGSRTANKELDQDYQAKIAKDQVLQPYSTMNTLIFVPNESLEDHMDITLVDKTTSAPLRFNVRIAA